MKKSKKLSCFILLTLMLSLVSGCWDRRELEDQAFVQALGLDMAKSGQLLVTFRIAIPSKSGLGQAGGATGGEGSIAAKSSLLTSVVAPTIPAAITLASSYVNREINLMHVKTFVFGEGFARKGVAPIMSILSRYREFRRNIFICVSAGEAHKFLERNEPDLEKSYSKWWEGVKMMEDREAIHPGTLYHEFITDMSSKSKDPVAIFVAVNKKSQSDDATKITIPNSFKQGELDVKSGDIPRTGGNVVEYAGTAVFKKDKLVDTLTITETRALLMLSGRFVHGLVTVPDPLQKKSYIPLEIKQGSAPIIKVAIEGDEVIIQEKVSLEGDLMAIQGMEEYATNLEKRKLLESAVKNIIKQRAMFTFKKLQKHDCDAVGYGDYVRRRFLTRQEWMAFDWPSKVDKARLILEVDFNIRRTGMQGDQPEVYK